LGLIYNKLIGIKKGTEATHCRKNAIFRLGLIYNKVIGIKKGTAATYRQRNRILFIVRFILSFFRQWCFFFLIFTSQILAGIPHVVLAYFTVVVVFVVVMFF